MEKTPQEVAVTEDLKPILSVLKEEDAKQILQLKDELADNWNKKQIFRTETEMRISVLNDARHPTPAAKYWQSVREMSAHFDALMGLAFEIRRNTINRLKLEKKMEKALDKGDELKQMEFQVDLDENLYTRANMEQVAHDRVREIQTWSKLKAELDDGTFDNQNVNTHQPKSIKLYLENKAKSLGPNSEVSEIINALGPLNTINRLSTEEGNLLTFKEAKLQLSQGQQESSQ
jgi:hypothetical protein